MKRDKNFLRKRNTGFTMVSNEVINNAELSWKAKGLFCYLNSKPDGWQFYLSDIKNRSSDGTASISAGLKELEEAGVLTRNKRRGEGGQVEYDYEVCNSPIEVEPKEEEPMSAEEVAKLMSGGPVQVDTNVFFFDDFWNAYDKKTDRAACEKKWNALKSSEQEAILKHVPMYVAATPDKKYRKNPQTYLNGRTWEDEDLPNSGGFNGPVGHALHDPNQNQFSSSTFRK